MGQTLSHGVYLPNEGERNCYAGLASNWQILNTAVGAIAEKAPLVHTHTVSQIADFPAYGTTAGTICEGNDSRLSDARPPVAHTHTKSDVTDLLNSNFIPSANNTYDLGSSTYQWNNLYAKNYYYNGVAWGLDKANTWTVSQRMACNPTIWDMKNTTYILGTAPSGNKYLGFIFYDSADTDMGRLCVQCHKNGNNYYILGLKNSDGTNTYDGALRYSASQTNERAFYPEGNTDLGTTNNKWKTLNGINPGALSLPNFDSDGYTDLSSDLTENVQYTYTPVVDGWLALYAQVNGFHAENAVGIFNADLTLGNDSFRWANTATAAINLQRQTGKYFGSVILPVRAGYPYYCWLRVDQSTTLGQKKLIFYKAKGNV